MSTRIRSAPGPGLTWRLAQGWTCWTILLSISIAACALIVAACGTCEVALLGWVTIPAVTAPRAPPRGRRPGVVPAPAAGASALAGLAAVVASRCGGALAASGFFTAAFS